MTVEVFHKKMVEYIKQNKKTCRSFDDIGEAQINGLNNIVGEFAQDLMTEITGVINGKISERTALLVAACLEDAAKAVRNLETDDDAKMFELLFRISFSHEVISMTIPKKIGEDE